MPKTKRTKIVENEPPKNTPSNKKRKIESLRVVVESLLKPASATKAAVSTARRKGRPPTKSVATATNTFKVKIASRPTLIKRETKRKSNVVHLTKDIDHNADNVIIGKPATDTASLNTDEIRAEVTPKKVNPKESAPKKAPKKPKVAPKADLIDTNTNSKENKTAKISIANPRGRPKRVKKPVIAETAFTHQSEKRGRAAKNIKFSKSKNVAQKPTAVKTVAGRRRGRKTAVTNRAST